ncbi:MAG: type VI secretion system contractile sheath large subunit [Polyangiaceae bacterium]|nr:type VI secretion system contractile sheath large subunit [Polyangiaceae bacterium]
MPTKPSRTGIEMNFTFAKRSHAARKDPDQPLRVLILGDFAGRTGRTGDTIVRVRPRRVDPADIDAALRAVAPQLELELGQGRTLSMRFEQMEDFHPNELYERLDLFASFRSLRRELKDPARAAEALSRIRGRAAADATAAAPVEAPAREPDESERDALTRLLGRPSTEPAKPQSNAARMVDAFVGPLVPAQVAAPPSAELAQAQRAVDEAISALMRAVLHDAHFTALEATWRGLVWTCNQLCETEDIQLFILDLSKSELAAQWTGSSDGAALEALLTGAAVPQLGDAPWGIIVGDYEFEMSDEDVELLGRLASASERAGAAFVTGARWSAVANASGDGASRAWAELRSRPEASHLGVAVPGFLLRLPYGPKTDPIEPFEFEELAVPSDYSQCLWGNSALACAALLGMSFIRSGWNLSPGDELDIAGLPVHVYRNEDGETVQAPCAEAWLSSANAEQLSTRGLMVLQAVRGQDRVRLLRFQSIHDPPTTLSGPWLASD